MSSDLDPVIAHCRSVYRYWREQGFSPQDSRMMVGSYLFSFYGHEQSSAARQGVAASGVTA